MSSSDSSAGGGAGGPSLGASFLSASFFFLASWIPKRMASKPSVHSGLRLGLTVMPSGKDLSAAGS